MYYFLYYYYISAFSLIVVLFTIRSSLCFSIKGIAPETTAIQRQAVQRVLNKVYGTEKSNEWEARRHQARVLGKETALNIPQHELVYGELGLDALAKILDAVGVKDGDQFMDIGAGDGMLVTGASMLYSDYLQASRGIEIVPELHERSLQFQCQFKDFFHQIQEENYNYQRNDVTSLCPITSLDLGNVYESDLRTRQLFSETTLAVCFATTWSRGIKGRKLQKLSEALGKGGVSELQSGARLVVIDGVLNHENDGFHFGGEFQLFCSDTAPYSVARLYTKI